MSWRVITCRGLKQERWVTLAKFTGWQTYRESPDPVPSQMMLIFFFLKTMMLNFRTAKAERKWGYSKKKKKAQKRVEQPYILGPADRELASNQPELFHMQRNTMKINRSRASMSIWSNGSQTVLHGSNGPLSRHQMCKCTEASHNQVPG